MAKSMIDRYRTILSADPSSMVFIELAKALIDQGDLAEAGRVCEAGMREHDDSIVGQVLWGRALLGQGDPEAAMDHFDAAVALEPENPYAYNLIGEALLHQQLFRSALPLLRKAVSLQPGDTRVRQWLEQAERAVGESRDELAAADPDPRSTAAASSSEGDGPDFDATVPSPFDPKPPAAQDTDPTVSSLQQDDATERSATPESSSGGENPFADPFDAAFGKAPAAGPGGDATEVLTLPPPEALGQPPPTTPQPADAVSAITHDATQADGTSPFSDYFDAAFGRVDTSAIPASEDGIIPGMTATFSNLETAEAAQTRAATGVPRPATGSVGVPVRIVPGGPSTRDPTLAGPLPTGGASGDALEAEAPPPLPPPLPGRGTGATQGLEDDRSELFGLKLPPKPGAARAGDTPRKKTAPVGDETAAAMAAEYERELRARLIPDDVPRTLFQRRWKWILAGAAVTLALTTATVVTLYARSANRQESIREGLAAAHNGIARDSYQAYLAALSALSAVLDLDEKNAEAKALSAQVEAILFAELDPDPARRDRAAALVADPQVAARYPDLALDARYHLLAPDARAPVGREILAAIKARPDSALLHYLAGRHRLAQRKADEATKHFQKALSLEPGHARTVLELARYLESLGQWKEAASYYDNLRENFPGHIRAQLGAARTLLEREENLDGALEVLKLVEREHGEHLAPEEAVVLEGLFGRILEARGDHAKAVRRLEAAVKAHPERGELQAILARTFAAHFELPEALAAARKAVTLRPTDIEQRRLLVQILLDWGRYADADAKLGKVRATDPRLLLQKAQATLFAGKLVTARKALERTRNDAGKMPAKAAIYLALVDAEAGEITRAKVVLDRAAKARRGDPLILWAQGRVALLADQLPTALRYLDKALARDDRAYRTRVERAEVLKARGRRGPAMEAVSAALAINPYFREGRLLLGELHLLAGEAEAAKEVFARVIADHPREPAAHRGLAEALLTLDQGEAALKAAAEAKGLAPRDARVLHTYGRAQLAIGKPRAAAQTLQKARRLDADNPALLADLGWALLAQGGKARARQAKTSLEQALELDRRNTRARLGLGRAQLRLGQKEAIATLKAALRSMKGAKASTRAEAYRDLARASLEVGRKPDRRGARLAYQKALDAEDDVSTHLALGKLLLDDGRERQAVGVLEKAIALDETSAAAHLELGRARAATGDIEGARAALDRCLLLSPKGPLAREARKILTAL